MQNCLTLPKQKILHQDEQNTMLQVHCLTFAGNTAHTARRNCSTPLALKRHIKTIKPDTNPTGRLLGCQCLLLTSLRRCQHLKRLGHGKRRNRQTSMSNVARDRSGHWPSRPGLGCCLVDQQYVLRPLLLTGPG